MNPFFLSLFIQKGGEKSVLIYCAESESAVCRIYCAESAITEI